MELKSYTIFVTEEYQNAYTIKALSEADAEAMFKEGIVGRRVFSSEGDKSITHVEEE